MQKVAERTSDTIPEVKQLVTNLQTVSTQISDTIPEVKETISEVKSLTASIRRVLPVAVICIVLAAVSALGTMLGVVVLLLR